MLDGNAFKNRSIIVPRAPQFCGCVCHFEDWSASGDFTEATFIDGKGRKWCEPCKEVCRVR